MATCDVCNAEGVVQGTSTDLLGRKHTLLKCGCGHEWEEIDLYETASDYTSPYPDGLPGHSAGNKASTDAAAAILAECSELQRQVYERIDASGDEGETCWAISQAMDRAYYTIAPRITELKKLDLVKDSGRVREIGHAPITLKRRRTGTVWVATRRGETE